MLEAKLIRWKSFKQKVLFSFFEFKFCVEDIVSGVCFPLVDEAVNRADWHGCQESIDQHMDVLPMRAKVYNEICKPWGKHAAWGFEGACPLRKEPAALAA